MEIEENNCLGALFGGLAPSFGGSQAGMFGSVSPMEAALMQQQHIKIKRYGDCGAKRQLTFIEELREEIDNWLLNCST